MSAGPEARPVPESHGLTDEDIAGLQRILVHPLPQKLTEEFGIPLPYSVAFVVGLWLAGYDIDRKKFQRFVVKDLRARPDFVAELIWGDDAIPC